MIVSIYSDRMGEVIAAPERFDLSLLGDDTRPLPQPPDGPTLVYGITPTPRGEISEEIFINSGVQKYVDEPSRGVVGKLINQSLEEVALLEEQVPGPLRGLREQAVKLCIDQGYNVLAGILVYHSADGEPFNFHFYAKPLGQVVFDLRSEILGLNRERETEEDQEPGSVTDDTSSDDSPLFMPESAKEYLVRPDRFVLQHTARLMSSLLLPASIGEPITPYLSGS